MKQGTTPGGRAFATGASIAVVVLLSACGNTAGDTGSPGSAGGTTSSASTPATGSPTPTGTGATSPSAETTNLPVYWIGESRRSFALYRELRDVANDGGPVSSAVSAMTRLKPLDPDYMTPWRPASRVTGSQAGQAITVDLSADAFANTQVGSEVADRAVQQLVYTATAAAAQAGTPATSVKITVDGGPYTAWGVIQLGEPIRRAPIATVQAHIWVTSPQEGQELPAGSVRFKGFGTSFENNFVWKVRDASGGLVSSGFATGDSSDGSFGEFAFSAQLTPGTYSVEVSEDDASGGAEGPGAATDDKTFTVR